MRRRTFLAAATAAAGAPARSRLGIATTCYLSFWRPRDTLQFLEHAHSIGAAGIQASLASLEPDYLKRLRARAEQLGLYIEVMAALPRAEMERFVRTVGAAREVGALCVRSACLSGRRYETFSTLEEWRKFVADSHAAVARAVPVVEKERIPLALENHKDWTVDEMVELLKKHGSDYLGACVDTGNNVAMLDDPMDVVERLAPFALSTHIKDMAVADAPEGFLLSEVVLGEGMLDLRRIMDIIARARPKTRMTLEMITRDPLLVPCLTDKYWATWPGRSPLALARALRMVRVKKFASLPRLSGLDRAAQLKIEADNVKKCLAFA
ncbi:MAG: sugar phosphate isomerase/epimerase [Acidobacteria bacterium]|nr:sugar phosphate isomerase/epimerase [Acidobacteriota bacterium]